MDDGVVDEGGAVRGSLIRRLDRWYFRPFVDQPGKRIRRSIVDRCGTLLDVGCGPRSKVEAVSDSLRFSVGVDISEEAIRASRGRGIHMRYVVLDVSKIGQTIQP